MKRTKSFIKCFFIILLSLFIIYVISSIVLSRQVSKRITELKAQGEAVSINDFNQQNIPDAQNGAVDYMKIFDLLEITIIMENDVIRGIKSKTAEIDYTAFKTPESVSEETWDRTRKIMSKYQTALEMVDAAASKPKCSFPVDWKNWPVTVFAHYSGMRELTRLLMIDSLIASYDEDMNKAVKRINQMIKVSNSLDYEPLLITTSVKIAIVSIGIDTIKTLDNFKGINNSHAKSLDETISSIDLDKSYKNALRGERASIISMCDKLKSNRLNQPSTGQQEKAKIIETIFPKYPLLYLDELASLNYIEKMISKSEIPYRDSIRNRTGRTGTDNLPFYAILTKNMIPVYYKTKMKNDEVKSNIYCCQIYLRLISYKEKFDEYPETITQLSSISDKKIENDPFSGKEFIYKRKGEGFSLYGIGPNLRDDGGVNQQKNADIPSDKKSDDIVWDRVR